MILKFDEFLRSVSISKDNSYSMLLGAGCSISSDIQSAYDCIWEWKKIIYKSNNPNVRDWIENYKNPKVQDVIQTWLDNQGNYIAANDSDEYSFYAQKCFPIDDNRRQYFQGICTNKKPAIGYRTIPLLVKQGMLDSVWTTNFDDLLNVACINGSVQGIDISLETAERINQRTQNKNELPIIKLHGDFKYGDLKNTSAELQEQDETLRNKLIDYVSDKNLIILGYSGRDKSLMETLKQAYSKKGAGILFWCGYGDSINDDVTELLGHINQQGRKGYYIATSGFDNTLVNLTKLVVEENFELKEQLKQLKNVSELEDTRPFNLTIERKNKILKSNLYPLEFPKEVLVFNASIPERPWKTVKDITLQDFTISAIPHGKDIWAFGTAENVKQNFSDLIQGDLQRKPLTNIRIHHGGIQFLLLSTICKVFSKTSSLQTNFKDKVWDENKFDTIYNHKVYNALKFGIEKIEGSFYLALNPDFHISETGVSKEIKQQIGLTFFHKIWNKHFNDYLNTWRGKLFTQTKYEFPPESGTGFVFKIKKNPIFTDVCDLNYQYSITHNVPDYMVKMKGIQFKEIGLLFSTNHGQQRVSDIHPMHGLLKNRPYDTGLNSLLSDTINLGVICPEEDAEKLHAFLNKQNQEIAKNNPKDNYIIDFKGFHRIYGLSLNIPTITSQNWLNVNNPISKTAKEIVHEIKTNICDAINNQCSIGSQKTVVIYIPKRWDNYLSYSNDVESFNLHDYIKAFCAEKGVTSQIIREKTVLDTSLDCQINWWLSLSYFVKSLRTPWVINNTDKTTAFAGIGYSVNTKEEDKGHIVLGCSHIYSSNGEGLKYKLSKINDNVKWINKKPHLSYDDAYEFGKNVINLFYESMNELPKRVVIHKRTFYTKEEKQGILDSLHDNMNIENIDLIEINFEDNIRYVSSKIRNGKAEIDGFSVSRGTCIQLNGHEALLYAHGVVPSVQNPKYNFYPGGRYIPKPLRVIKHYGNGSMEQIMNEILGLTKMNWNSLNMYSQLPATISSSNEIARIGRLIENTEKIQYDYRYFM